MSRNVPTSWLYGFLDLCLLSLLEQRRDYGRALLERLTAAGFDEVPGGTLYPALLRLEKQGLVRTERVDSPAGPPRKYYELSDRGQSALREQRDAWTQFRQAVDHVVTVGTADRLGSGRSTR